MKQRSSALAGTLPAGTYVVVERSESRSPEWGRKAILTGWLVAMAGIAGYIYTMIHAPEEAGILQSIAGGGPMAWLSAALVITGVAVWLAGNLALIRAMADVEKP